MSDGDSGDANETNRGGGDSHTSKRATGTVGGVSGGASGVVDAPLCVGNSVCVCRVGCVSVIGNSATVDCDSYDCTTVREKDSKPNETGGSR